jgi:predicted dithiol-disulfide oxidoreductase (DUF899 family)
MQDIVPKDEWLTARKAFLLKEKEFTRQRDELNAERRQLPMVRVDQNYMFDTATGRVSLSDLFGDCSQLIVYHFMYGPGWDEGCPSCSFWADSYDGVDVHLRHRDTTLVAIARTSVEKIEAYKKRMGWRFTWASSLNNSFNRDFDVQFTEADLADGPLEYNYRPQTSPFDEAPGISVFSKDADGNIYHTYSCFSRGLDMLNGAYHMLDLTSKGRDEQDLPFTMAWLKRRDQYEN